MGGYQCDSGHGNRGDCRWAQNAVGYVPLVILDGTTTDQYLRGEMVVGAANKAPKYLKEAGYRCPTDPHDGLMQYAFQTKLTTFELFSSMPSVLKDFNAFMGNTMGARNYWVDWFPVRERLLEGGDPESALLVDVGAGKGHDLLAFREKYPCQGRLVLQDLEQVISGIGDIDPAIELMAYDFFTEQLVQGNPSAYVQPDQIIRSPTNTQGRRTLLLLPSHPARLVGREMPEDTGTGQEGYEAGLFQTLDS